MFLVITQSIAWPRWDLLLVPASVRRTIHRDGGHARSAQFLDVKAIFISRYEVLGQGSRSHKYA